MGLTNAGETMAEQQPFQFTISGTKVAGAVFNFSMSIGNEDNEKTIKLDSVRGTKRPYAAIEDIPTPQSSPGLEQHHISVVDHINNTAPFYFDDDRNSDFELIRVPKKRAYDLIQVPRTSPKQRDEANTPLTMTGVDGKKVMLWAKMDTGADTNFINLTTLTKLLGAENTNASLYPLRADEHYNLVGANHIDFTHRVDLSFHAGKSHRHFENISFVVYPDVDAEGSSTDGVPNVIIGIKTLQENHMVMVDFEYHVEELDETLEVISPRADSENPEFRTIGPIIRTKGGNAPGIRRPR